MKLKILGLVIVLMTIMVTSCSQPAIIDKPSLAPTQIRIETFSVVTPVPSPSPIPTATPTPTTFPTLEPDRVKETIQALLQETKDCGSPCVWGITPGETTINEAQRIFTHLGIQLMYVTSHDNRNYYYSKYEFDNGLSISFSVAVQRGIINNVVSDIHPEIQIPGVPRAWKAYSPETLIERYGNPSKVDFFVDRIRDGNVPPKAWYGMNMHFKEVGMIIEYGGAELSPLTNFQACPLIDPFEFIRIWFGEEPEHPPGEVVPLIEATNLTMEEFVELMTGDPERACFKLNMEIFP